MVILVGNGCGDMSSNPGPGWLQNHTYLLLSK